MKRVLFCTALLAMVGQAAMAQDVYDITRLASTDLNGTARFIGMGGALSALGGDVTTTATNPAGLGIYRSGDLAVSGGSLMLSNDDMIKDNRASFDQLGVVFSTKYSNYSPLRYLNFGINYRKRANLFDSFGVANNWNGVFSQTYSMADMTYDATDFKKMPSLAAIAAQAGVLIHDEQGYMGVGADDSYFNTIQTGGIHELDFSIGANYNDRVFLGASLGYYDVRLTRSSFYTENGVDGAYYNLWNDYFTDGAGVDLKLGAIFRPIDESGFRFGVALHTPVMFSLTDQNSAYIEAYDENDNMIGSQSVDVDAVDYRLSTPWKFNFSLGHTIGSQVALGAEYELATYTSMGLSNADGTKSDFTDYVEGSVSNFLKTAHTLRVGIEVKPVEDLSIRAGYNFTTALFDKGAYRSLKDFTDIYIDTLTDSQYENLYALNRFTAGIGYRLDKFYMDLAYQYSTQKSDFYAFDDYYTDSASSSKVFLPATAVTKNRHQLTLTLGYRF